MIDKLTLQEIVDLCARMRAHNQALVEQRETVLRSAAQTLPEDAAVTAPLMYPEWDWQSCKQDMVVNYNGQLYRVLNAPTTARPPDAEGMLAVYCPIVPGHAGTMADPISWVYGMNCKEGLYYKCAEQIWRCKSDMSPCTWTPGTAPTMWEAVA